MSDILSRENDFTVNCLTKSEIHVIIAESAAIEVIDKKSFSSLIVYLLVGTMFILVTVLTRHDSLLLMFAGIIRRP